MKKFRVFLRGENFLMKVEDGSRRLGFHTTRFIEAPDDGEAERLAVESVRKSDRLRTGMLNDRLDGPMLFAEEVEEVSAFPEIGSQEPGFNFYDEDGPVAH